MPPWVFGALGPQGPGALGPRGSKAPKLWGFGAPGLRGSEALGLWGPGALGPSGAPLGCRARSTCLQCLYGKEGPGYGWQCDESLAQAQAMGYDVNASGRYVYTDNDMSFY